MTNSADPYWVVIKEPCYLNVHWLLTSIGLLNLSGS